ncbi:AraC family transcriptional regulator [Acidocella sp.]|uniref:AraC family transcriptional regulator n=1 Tax=Acidocella sp. TaxID=50710 RepID=UPI00260546E5|nr:AraC family transcriptional regulator [Acidocella sp.]
MPVLAFDMTTANHELRRHEFRGKNNSDYYEGELRPLSPRDVDMRIDKSVAGEYFIYKLTSRSGLVFKRNWAHIRSDKTNVTVFWFVRRGRITVSYPGAKHAINPQECAVTRSCRPFNMELTPDKNGLLEVMHVVVPSHELHSIISDGLEAGRPFPASKGDLFLVERIFSMLFDEDDQIDADISEQLVRTLLTGIGKSITRFGGIPAPRSSIAEKRTADIKACINRHIANPDLNARMVAERCGISLRYLCHILKKNDLSFSHLIWERRIEMAEAWLKDPAMQHHLVCEIAYLVGFKSSAHFSRMFKTRYGVAPREYRDQHTAQRVAPAREVVP